MKRRPLQTAGGVQELRLISEPDMLRLIVNSALPAAERFERWVFEEVLPTIRKTGAYIGLGVQPGQVLARIQRGQHVDAGALQRHRVGAAQRHRQAHAGGAGAAHHRAEHAVGGHPTAAAFYVDWSGGHIEDLPYQTCLASQAYQAYTHWCALAREGQIARREAFSTTVLNCAQQVGRPAQIKPMRIGGQAGGMAQRVLLVTPPPAEGQGAWATGLVEGFEEVLRGWLAVRASHGRSGLSSGRFSGDCNVQH